MAAEVSLSHSQEPSICSYHEPDKSSPWFPHPTSWRSILILSSCLRIVIPSGLFPSGFPTKSLYAPLTSPTYNTCPGRLILHKHGYKTNKMIQYTGVLFHLILLLVYFAQFAYLAVNWTHSKLLFGQKGICPCGATKTRWLEPCQCRRAVGSWVVRKRYIALCDLSPSSAFTIYKSFVLFVQKWF